MPTHTRLEKDLKRDIVRKNTVMKRLRRLNRRADLWQKKAESGKNRRWNKKYIATSLRYRAEMNRLRNIIRPLVADLDERIHEEMEFSKQEVGDFKKQLKAEMEEMDRIGARLQEIEKQLKADEEKLGTDKPEPELEKKISAEKKQKRELEKKKEEESKKTERLEKELKSEAVDEQIFSDELKHISKEKEQLEEESEEKEKS